MEKELFLILVSILFWTTPVALVIHLIVWKNKANNLKIKVAYGYVLIWILSFLSYFRIFVN